MHEAGSEPLIQGTKQLKTCALDRTATGILRAQYIIHTITLNQSARQYVPKALIVTSVTLKTSNLTIKHQFASTKNCAQ